MPGLLGASLDRGGTGEIGSKFSVRIIAKIARQSPVIFDRGSGESRSEAVYSPHTCSVGNRARSTELAVQRISPLLVIRRAVSSAPDRADQKSRLHGQFCTNYLVFCPAPLRCLVAAGFAMSARGADAAQAQGAGQARQLVDPLVSTPGGEPGSIRSSSAGDATPWSGQSGASGNPLMTADAIRAAAADFNNCIANLWPDAARRGISARELRSLHRGADAGSAHHGFARRAAGIHQGAVGLSRSAGERRPHRARPRAARAICADLRRRAAHLRRRSGHRRRDLGRRIQLRHARRQPPGDPLDRDARLRRPPPRLFPRGVFVDAGNPAARRRAARASDRLVGRRVRPDAIHADLVQALRRRFRRRRPSRRRRLGAGRDRLDRQQSENGRLGRRPDLGLRSRAAAEFRLSARRPLASR